MSGGGKFIIVGAGLLAGLYLLSKSSSAETPPTPPPVSTTIEQVSCHIPSSVPEGTEMSIDFTVRAPASNPGQVSGRITASVGENCTRTKDVTLNPGETRTETIPLCKLPAGDYTVTADVVKT